MEWYYLTLGILIGLVSLPVLWLLYWRFGANLIEDVLELPPGSRIVRRIQVALLPVVAYFVWTLDFRQFSYGTTAVIGGLWAFLWTRTLLRGETWLWQREGRFNAEWAGPIVLAILSVGYMSSAISPWF